MMQKTILFDINETVLDLSSLKPDFVTVFGSEEALPLWFAKLLHTSTVCIATNVSSDFATLANITLNTIAVHYSVNLTDEDRTSLLNGLANLQAYSDIKPALVLLREHGFRTVAFSNSSANLIKQQIENAMLTEYFDRVISVETTDSFKPDPTVYQFASEVLNVPITALRLVATHDWDTHGALTAGLKAAYIARTQAPYNPLYLMPDINDNTMLKIAQKIISVSTKKTP
ncbi:haloacid dehalogenase type II [Vibrio sp. F74]|uniref:haloacid dehalogenase type II n=1 Tax=Vibrio sp. F74 TaxID=700020 RepID=UPI0035F5C637